MKARPAGPALGMLGVLVVGVAALGCGGTSGGTSVSAQVTAWARSTGFTASLQRLRGDLGRIGGARPGAPLRTLCDVLVTDSLAGNEQLPTPDNRLTEALSRAYSTAAAAGHACFDGADGNSTLLARSAADRAAAITDLVVAEARYDAVTSTLPGSGT